MSTLAAPRLSLPNGTILAGEATEKLWKPGSPMGVMAERIGVALGQLGFDRGCIEGVGGAFSDGLLHRARRRRGINVLFNLATVAGTKTLDHLNGKVSYTLVTPNYIALLTGTALAADTGVTITTTNNVEANYTSYARLAMAASDYGSATAGAAPPTATSSAPVAQKTWPNCTGGTSTVTNWCVVLGSAVTRGNAGDITFYGTCTSTVISVTQTPPTVAANGFTFTDT